MKRIFALLTVLALTVVLASCGPETTGNNDNNDTTSTSEPAAETVSVQDIMAEIESKGYLPENPVRLTADDLLDYYGIQPADVKDCAVVQNPSGYQDEIIVIEAVNSEAAAAIKGILLDQVSYKKDQMQNYDAEMYDILSDCDVVTNGNYIGLFISSQREAINGIFNSYFA